MLLQARLFWALLKRIDKLITVNTWSGDWKMANQLRGGEWTRAAGRMPTMMQRWGGWGGGGVY